MFTNEQLAELKKKLNPKHIRTRTQSGFTLYYIEGWHAIAEANRIFGYGNWDRETIYNKQVCSYEYNGKHKVGYEAKVKVTVGDVVREGTGTGSGIAKDLYDAIEGAAKEAETDAMKRALMTFGNQFGLALYDKQQSNVAPDLEATSKRIRKMVNDCLTKEELDNKLHHPATELALEELEQDKQLHDGLMTAIALKEESFR